MTIEDFLRMLLRNLFLLIVMTVLGAAAGYGFSYTKPEVYSASALGYVSASGGTDEAGNPVQQASGNMNLQYAKAQSYLPLFSTRAVGETIVEELGLAASPDAVAGSLSVSIDPNAPILTVTAYADSAEEASAIANAAVEATALEARTLETGGNANAPISVQLTTYQNAVVPGAPVSPDRNRMLLVGAGIGLLLALAASWLRNRNDSRIHTPENLAATVDAPLLAILPETKDLLRAKDDLLVEPKSFAAREAIRKLRTNLRFVDVDEPPRSIVVTSGTPGDGKSVVAGNLARVMARAGQRTLLIDADLRRPMVAAQFGVDGSVGLSQLLAASVTLEDAVQPSSVPLLTLLPAGQVPPNPSELLGSRRMKDLISELSKDYFVIVDAPPVLAVTDAQLLARHADGAIMVASAGRTRSLALSRSVSSIRDVGAKVYGVVLNRASSSRFTRLAYGDNEYGYGSYGKYGKYGYGGGSSSEDVVLDEATMEPIQVSHEQLASASARGTMTERATEEAPAASAATPEAAAREKGLSQWPPAASTHDEAGAPPASARRPRGRRVATTDQDQE